MVEGIVGEDPVVGAANLTVVTGVEVISARA
jgi:hypothetical protein